MKFNTLWHNMITLFLLEFTCACLSSTADKITTPKTDKLQYVEWSPVSDHLVSGRGEGLLLSTHVWTRNVKAGTALQILVHTRVLSSSHFGQYTLFIYLTQFRAMSCNDPSGLGATNLYTSTHSYPHLTLIVHLL